MSFADGALIFLIALILFGPKKLPELARQLGRLMGEFRRASNDFRMQLEDEMRISERDEQNKKIQAITETAPQPPVYPEITPGHLEAVPAESTVTPEPIAVAGDVTMMPPSTGLPVERKPEPAETTTGVSADDPAASEVSHG